jgi:PKD repeat protein
MRNITFTLILFLSSVISIFSQEVEPNDTPEQAGILLFDTNIKGDISTTDVNDWYRFEMEKGGLFELDIRKAEGNIIFWVYLHDGEMEGEPIIQQLRMFNNDTLLTLKQHLLEGSYYIRIGTATTLIPYSLTPRLMVNNWPDDIEPNNDEATAIQILPNDEVTGNILYYEAGVGKDPQDWYVLDLEESGLLELEMQKSVLLNSEFTVYLKDGEKEGFPTIKQYRLFLSDSLHTIKEHLLEGKYFIQIGSPYLPNTYRLKTTFTPPEWEEDAEANDDVITALTMHPNDTITGNIGYYKAGSGLDTKDWYQLALDTAGYLEIKIQKEFLEGTEFTVYLYDGEEDPVMVINQKRLFQSEGLVFMTNHLLEGTYYVQVTGAIAPNNYQMVSTLTLPQWEEDLEHNDEVATALRMEINDTITGTIAYYKAGVGGDAKDWYQLDIDSVGVLELDIQKEIVEGREISVYLYDGEMDPVHLINQKRLYHTEGQVTMRHPLLEGTYFLQVTGATAPHNYQIIADFSSPYWPEDAEPNNDTLNANIVSLSDSITGNLYFYDAGLGYDTRDFYEFELIEEGLVKLDIFKENNDAIFRVFLYDANQDGNPLINQTRLFVDEFHAQIKNYLLPGTYRFQVTDPSRDLEYLIKPIFIPLPQAGYSYMQVNNSIAFANNSMDGLNYLWEFGDGQESEAVNPFHEYENPGVYDVCMIVFNEAGRDTSCQQVLVEGLAAVYPNTGGNTGDVTLTVYGGGLDSLSIILLEQDGMPILLQDTVIQIQRDAIKGRLDLRNSTIGIYDLVVETKTGNRYILENAFKIEEASLPDPWVEINGRDRILFNTFSTYTVRYGNNGNVDATIVPIWLAFSDTPDLEINFSGANLFNPHSDIDSITIIEDQNSPLLYFTTDSVLGEPFNARIYPLILPAIPANTVHEFNIRIKTTENIKIKSWVNEPIFQAGFNNQRSDNSDEANENIFKCSATVLAKNYENAFLPPLNTMEVNCIIDEYKKALLTIRNVQFEAFLNTFTGKGTLLKGNLLLNIGLIANTLRKCVPQSAANKVELSQHVMNVLIGHYLSDKKELRECREPSPKVCEGVVKRIEEDCPQCGTFCANNISEKTIIAVSSFDPNEKDVLNGYTDKNYTFFRKTIPYAIHFENIDSATAPAHTVRVVDVLDAGKFKLSTFQFGSVTIADTTVTPEKGSYQMLMDIHLNPLNVVARVQASIDTLSGKVEWIFRSLDPVTLEEIEDPDVGFLPPNVSKPEGQGKVSFFIDLKEDLVNGDEVLNDAQIFFDANDPILTNVSSFVLDLGLPESTVEPLDVKTSDTLFQVQWSGSDEESGVRFYDVYVSEDDGNFERWRSRTSLTSDYFEGIDGKSYRFFSVAVDSVGNEEEIPDGWDAETYVTTPSEDIDLLETQWVINPNPASDELILNFNSSVSKPGFLEIYNSTGSKMYTQYYNDLRWRDNSQKIDISHFDQGIYFVVLHIDGRSHSRKLVIMR